MDIEAIVEKIRHKFLSRMDDGDWEEDLHPRDKDGKFSEKAESGGPKKAEDVKKDYDKALKEWNEADEKKRDIQKKLSNATGKDADKLADELSEAKKSFEACEKKLVEHNKKMLEAGYVWDENTGDFKKPSKKKAAAKKEPEKQIEKKPEKEQKKEPKAEPEKKTSGEPAVKPTADKTSEKPAKTQGQKKTEAAKEKPQAPTDKEPKKQEAEQSHKPVGATTFDKDAYSPERKDGALSSSRPAEIDKAVRGEAGRVWKEMSKSEKKTCVYYTRWAGGRFNSPQRKAGVNGDYSAQTDEIRELTEIVDRSSYDFDMILHRGNTVSGASKLLNVPTDFLEKASEKELAERLTGIEAVEYGWTSTGAAEGYGCLPRDNPNYTVQYRIYAPRGTKMLYCEPFSWFNNENGNPFDWWDYNWWDGESEQKEGFSREFEMLLQRDTKFRVTGARRDKGILRVDMEVVSQMEDK